MNSRSGLLFAALFLFLLAGAPVRGETLPRTAASHPALPENPSPSPIGENLFASGPSFPKAVAYPGATGSFASAPVPCRCDASLTPVARLRLTFTTYNSNGRIATDIPRVPGASRSPIGSANWTPSRFYGPLLDGYRLGHRGMSQVFTGKLFAGASSNLMHVLHLGSSAPNR